jgi:O-antigen ligase
MVGNLRTYIIERGLMFAMFLLLPILSFVNFPPKYIVISFLFIVVFFSYLNKNKTFRFIAFSKPLFIWLVLTAYQWMNAMYKHVPEVNVLDLFHGFKIYACIVFFAYVSIKDFNRTIISLVVVFTAYLLMSFLLNTESHNDRLSGVIFATALGQTAALLGVYVAYYCLSRNFSIKRSILYYILPLIVILSTQSRNSLAMLCIIFIGHVLAYNAKKGLKIWRLFIIIAIIAFISLQLLDLLIEHTELGQRFNDLSELKASQEVNGLSTGTFFDTIVGDRLRYYVIGYQLFLEAPITGIGMWNFKYLAGGDYPLHSEYMVQLCEGGIIAFSLWVWFYITIFLGIFKSVYPKYIKIVAIFSVISILFCSIYARVFYYEYFYPVIGIAISLSPSVNNKHKHAK